MPATQGITLPVTTGVSNEVIYPIDVFARTIAIRECPLVARLPRKPIGADKFTFGAKTTRNRSRTLGAALADNTNTTITLTDVSDLMIGDVIELVSGERVEVTADPTISNSTTGAGTVTVRRGIQSTTAASQANSSAATLIGNSRTGGEVDQSAYRQIKSFTTQAVQTFQFPVQISGKMNAMNNLQLAPGESSPEESERIQRLVDMMRDVEYSMLYGRYEYGATGNRNKMVGIRNFIPSTNVTTSPTSASAYKPSDFVRDFILPITSKQGYPTTLVLSQNFAQAFTVWSHPTQAYTIGTDVYGLPIKAMYVPFLGFDLELIPHPQLPDFTGFCLSLTDSTGAPTVFNRYIRQEQYNKRGNRGDAAEGEYLCDMAIEVADINHHSFVTGITGWST